MAQTRSTIPEPIQQWIDLTNNLIVVAAAWAAGDPEHQYPEAAGNLTRVMVLNAAFQAALTTAAAAQARNPGG